VKTKSAKAKLKPKKPKTTTIREDYPKVRIVKRRKGFAYQVDCRRKGWTGPAQPEFLTKKEALDKAREIAALVANKSIVGAGNYTSLLENGELAEFSKQLQPFGKTIGDAVAHYLEVLRSNQSTATSPRVTETLERWFAYKEAGTDGVLRPRSLGSLRYWSKRLAKLFPTQRLQDLTYDLIRKTTDELKTTEGKPASTHLRKHFIGHLGQFLNWCIQQGLTATNPTPRIKIKVPVPDAIFLSIGECRRIVSVLNRPEFKPLIGPVAIGLFTGIRVAEISRLQWCDIHLDQMQISVIRRVGKTRRGRSITIHPVLKAWLEKLDPNQPFVGLAPRRLMDRFKKELGFKWNTNVVRHTYATYWQSQNRDGARLSSNLGNTEAVASRHYVRMVSKADAEQFWTLYPYSETATQFFGFTEQSSKSGEPESV
jgi:integrase